MAVQQFWTNLKGMFASQAGSSLDAGLKPALSAAEITQAAKKYMYGGLVKDTSAGLAGEQSLGTNVPAIQVTGIFLLPDAAVTHDASNNATLTFGFRPTAGGGSQTALGTALTTVTVDWVANSQIALAGLTAVGTAVAANQVITCAITKAGTGVVIPKTLVVVEYYEL